ncbi:sensor histidine kinase [Microlunatus speluncae]|uniref:sensor histidine kinase n=1 Tax=Microlunatus speluncae TaxID=2594267 RepID=UPI00126619BE|nr:histidine kinase [Microlunatus speluncae]
MGLDEADRPVRRARTVALLAMTPAPLTTAIMPGIGLGRESDPTRMILAAVGIAAVVIMQCLAHYRSVSGPFARDGDAVRTGHRPPWIDLAFGLTVIISIPLVAPLAGDRWDSWAWLGGSVAGALPLLFRRAPVLIAGWIGLLVAVLVIGNRVGDPLGYGLTAISIGLTVAFMCGLPLALWRVVGDLRAGREARARLAVAEERLRFARDIHDVVGHTLSVIALKAELVERLQPVDPERSSTEAGELRRLTADALVQLRSTVDGYRGMDLEQQLAAVRDALDTAGIGCRVELAARPPNPAVSRLLAIALREATTNVLRHGGATDCSIALERAGDALHLRVINDVTPRPEPSARAGTGLAGLRERFAELGGEIRAGREEGRFVFEARLPAPVGSAGS